MRSFILILLFTQAVSVTFGQFKVCSARSNSINERYTLYSSSGNLAIDQVTINELTLLQNSFLVYPIFFFYDDSDGRNAKATDEVLNQRGPDGTVIFGKRLFNREFVRSIGGTTIPIIIAHEYAHVVDFKYGALSHASSKQKELFADVFAGMYIYVRSLNGWQTNLNAVHQCFTELGDTDFGSEDHHGTPQERTNALFYGHNFIRGRAMQGYATDLNTAIIAAKKYIDQFEEDDENTETINSNE